MEISPYTKDHLEQIVQLSLRAWAPVFAAIAQTMDTEIYQTFYPEGWEVSQKASVVHTCTSGETQIWVGLIDQKVAGFLALKLNQEDSLGEVYMIAVDPDHQRKGISKALMDFGLDYMKKEGISMAMIDTGGDPGHAPARASYEKAGFKLLPIARYFKKL
ncbi:GNAT family N-acetyltransferase [marine bacterium AO1-C]|nr:GNAT family N-acetyltransferase [marine bacterium AO1-C]